MSDTDNLIITYDPTSTEFQRIEAAAGVPNSGCAHGPTFLAFERSTAKFYEFFCGNKSCRREAAVFNYYCPVTPAHIEAGVTNETEVRGPKPLTITSVYRERKSINWFAPKANDCLTPFSRVPTEEQIVEAFNLFMGMKSTDVETVSEDSPKRRRR